MIQAVFCQHCEILTTVEHAKACKCARDAKVHIVCLECARAVAPADLGELVVEANEDEDA